ncbi:hypothetical protein [Chryseobacterium sp. SIMBA_029]|uniref:hypothetical protein n=1 Tax=Chryseobacterium sp. SIMBA_029 TaxID=3085772 RepID=UPI00397BD8E7
MKNFFLLITLMGFQIAFSQIQEDAKQTYGFTKEQLGTYNKPAEYPGGMMALRKDIANKIRMRKIKGEGIINARAKFIVTIEGKIDGIIVTGDNADFNKETERALKTLKARWKPAESNGIIVRSYYTFPLNISFK